MLPVNNPMASMPADPVSAEGSGVWGAVYAVISDDGIVRICDWMPLSDVAAGETIRIVGTTSVACDVTSTTTTS
jgi:hypothetical protein